jgi:hypothetical protein
MKPKFLQVLACLLQWGRGKNVHFKLQEVKDKAARHSVE